MSNILKRTITGIIFIAAVGGSAFFDYWAFTGVIGFFAFLGLLEFYKLFRKSSIKPNKILGLFFGIVFFAIAVLDNAQMLKSDQAKQLYIFTFCLSVLIFFFELKRKSKNPFLNIAITFLGIIYIIIPFALLVSLYGITIGNEKVYIFPVYYFCILWTYDTFAYLTGKKFGKHKLFERISNKKTWEGVIGGLLFSMIFAYIFSIYNAFFSRLEWLIFALVIGIAGTLGDLTESMLKRSLDKKDSGTLLPGHGGVLDRFDAVILSVPFVYVYLIILAFISYENS